MDDVSDNKVFTPNNHSVTQVYSDICRDVSNFVESCDCRSNTEGHILIVKSGIMSIAHCTLESLTEIKRSNCVFFLVDDTVTELFLKDIRPDGIDLNVFAYECGNEEIITCVKIVEMCLCYARRGSSVCLVLHGDYRLSDMITQRLSRQAHTEGINLKIVPSPGLLDCQVASMNMDLSIGTVTLNAVEFLLSCIELDRSSNIILRHLGDVKNASHNGRVSKLQCFHLLVDKLLKYYVGSKEVTLYQGTQYCLVHPPYEHVTLAVLSLITEEQLENISSDSSLYIPFSFEPSINITLGMTLGCLQDGTTAHAIVKRELGLHHDDYGPKETRAIKDLKHWVVPDGYVWTKDNELSDLLCEMSLNSNLLHHWLKTGQPTLESDLQNNALQSRDETAIEETIRHQGQHSEIRGPESGGIPWKTPKEKGQKRQTIKQMIVLYENDEDDKWDDSSASSDDSDIIREAYTEVPREEMAQWKQ